MMKVTTILTAAACLAGSFSLYADPVRQGRSRHLREPIPWQGLFACRKT
ncbi:MAG: hypothetical protein ACLT8E_00550 [Akkermansia sp.]